ncbi:lycopene cyclase family protein [Winogradskyella bathintestinalis]|uniref:Lycopene cyclase family protein n=1 Tax=Winogradskyella bathintestinalis TaxID=3035208 RepID=A0ABT7ZXD2_9FLAO|nr:lycopene cyclase family protein [Winogradskyella bathintestinalis]MDN3493671.1 lycopene cyclase family protein [Winogradskyella bathintestinalis]
MTSYNKISILATYDYIILGAGASGLMLAYRMSQDTFFDDKSILILDQTKDKGNDRTWCYWDNGVGEWDALLTKTWDTIFFGSESFSKTISISPFRYKMIESKTFYKSLWKSINLKSNFRFVEDTVHDFTELEKGVQIITENGVYFGAKVFNSLPKPEVYNSQEKYPVLQQHFVGWFVKTNVNTFDDSKATFMDFTVPQLGNTRFMYVLPIDKKTALFEYTLFSKDLLQYSDYEKAIASYLNENNISEYEIIEKEQGNIPMTAFNFQKLNSKHILNIGTAGGWTKASTGYTFKNTSKKTQQIVDFLKKKDDLSQVNNSAKYRFYDLIFLDVLANHNDEGAALFSSMFKSTDTITLFKFLDEESTLYEDLKVILSVPPKRFIQSLFKRFF